MHGDAALERREAVDDGRGDVAGAEDHDLPLAVVVGLEVQLHDAAAGHADVALEVPLDELDRGALRLR